MLLKPAVMSARLRTRSPVLEMSIVSGVIGRLALGVRPDGMRDCAESEGAGLGDIAAAMPWRSPIGAEAIAEALPCVVNGLPKYPLVLD